jgi:dTDP-4-amino-4,6-dideoxygalactose transaminase
MIPYGRQDINQTDIDAVVDVLRSDFLTQGPVVPRFEASIADYCGAAHALAVNSATSALHIACMALELGPGDLLWTVPNTFVATANVGVYCGADVDFVDADPDTYCMSIAALIAKLQTARTAGRLPKVVIPVHFAGQSCDMTAIGALAAHTNTPPSAIARTATSACSAFTPSKSSPRPKAGLRQRKASTLPTG